MTLTQEVLIIFIILSIVLFLLWRKAIDKLSRLKFQKQSLSTKYGKITEQFLPFLDAFPYDQSGFRFIGSPIDGVQFEDDKIIFFEFKIGTSRMTSKQSNIKELIESKKVYFEEIYLK